MSRTFFSSKMWLLFAGFFKKSVAKTCDNIKLGHHLGVPQEENCSVNIADSDILQKLKIYLTMALLSADHFLRSALVPLVFSWLTFSVFLNGYG